MSTDSPEKQAHDAWSLKIDEARKSVPRPEDHPECLNANSPRGGYVLGAVLSDGKLYAIGFIDPYPREKAIEKAHRGLQKAEIRIRGLDTGPDWAAFGANP
jgi:hypothetical protein